MYMFPCSSLKKCKVVRGTPSSKLHAWRKISPPLISQKSEVFDSFPPGKAFGEYCYKEKKDYEEHCFYRHGNCHCNPYDR